MRVTPFRRHADFCQVIQRNEKIKLVKKSPCLCLTLYWGCALLYFFLPRIQLKINFMFHKVKKKVKPPEADVH